MRTKIDLFSSGVIELNDEVPYSLNYAIADIREPDKRDASYSKTIRIPGSKNNDQVFQFIFEIDIDCNFNPNIKAPCILSIDDLQQMKGYLQLLKIYRTEEKKIEYEVTIRGQVGNIFTEWGDKELTDLDLSEFNHQYLKSVQQASWVAPTGVGYVYPLIDFGQTAGNTYDVTNFFPAVYVKQYIDKMFALAGFTYRSSFFDTDFFNKLIIPYNELTLRYGSADLSLRGLDVNSIAAGVHTHALTTLFTNQNTTINVFNTIVSDVSSQFSLATNKITVLYGGFYTIGFTGAYAKVSASNGQVHWHVIRERAGVFISLGSVLHAVTTSYTLTSTSLYLTNIPLAVGDKLHIGIMARVASGTATLSIDGELGYDEFEMLLENSLISTGADVVMNNAIPQKIKLRDFFTSIIKMFNLYVELDKDVTNQLNIEPRNDFYNAGATIDWTNKLDTSRELEMNPMGELDAVRYKFSYKEDGDYWNKKYKENHSQIYSEQNYFITNDFLKNTKLTELIFSPTPSVQTYSTDRIIPQIINTNQLGQVVPVKGFNIRILMYNGVKTSGNSFTYTSVIEGTTTETDYPMCGMLDEPTLPTEVLDYGVPFEVYFNTTAYTNNNLFNKYWKQFIEEISDKDSKIVTGWFALNPKDILILDFRNEFVVQGHFLRLNKIYDYNPLQNNLTLCEFIKIKKANPFVAETITSGVGAVDVDFVDGVRTPLPIGGELPHFMLGNFVSDLDNYVSQTGRSVIVTGTGNSVGEGCSNISVLGSSGCIVGAGLTGVTLINCSGVIVTDSNRSYIQNVAVNSGSFSGVTPTLAQVLAAGYTIGFSDVINNTDNSGQIQLADTNALLFHNILTAVQSPTRIDIDAPIVKLNNQGANKLLTTNAQSEIQGIAFSSGVIYTPTLTNVANLGASTAYACQYYRIGNCVTVSGKVDVDPTAPAAATQLGISLPIASNFATQQQCGGTAFASGVAGQGAAIRADATNDRAEMVWVAGDITNQSMYFQFTYYVI